MKKIVAIIAAAVILLAMAFAEYRYIMCHLCPYTGENGTVYIEIFGMVDEYYADPVSAMDLK